MENWSPGSQQDILHSEIYPWIFYRVFWFSLKVLTHLSLQKRYNFYLLIWQFCGLTLNLGSTKITQRTEEVGNVFTKSHILESLDTDGNSWVSKVIIQEKVSRLFTKIAAISNLSLFHKIFHIQSDFWALLFFSACEKCRIFFLLLFLYARSSEYKKCVFTSESSCHSGDWRTEKLTKGPQKAELPKPIWEMRKSSIVGVKDKCYNGPGQLMHSFFKDQNNWKLQFQTRKLNVLQVKRWKKYIMRKEWIDNIALAWQETSGGSTPISGDKAKWFFSYAIIWYILSLCYALWALRCWDYQHWVFTALSL